MSRVTTRWCLAIIGALVAMPLLSVSVLAQNGTGENRNLTCPEVLAIAAKYVEPEGYEFIQSLSTEECEEGVEGLTRAEIENLFRTHPVLEKYEAYECPGVEVDGVCYQSGKGLSTPPPQSHSYDHGSHDHDPPYRHTHTHHHREVGAQHGSRAIWMNYRWIYTGYGEHLSASLDLEHRESHFHKEDRNLTWSLKVPNRRYQYRRVLAWAYPGEYDRQTEGHGIYTMAVECEWWYHTSWKRHRKQTHCHAEGHNSRPSRGCYVND